MTATTTAATNTDARRRPRPRGAAALAALLVVVLAGCGGDDADEADADGDERGTRVGAEEVYPGELHECAGDWPVPEGMTVVETARGRDQAGEPTCVVAVRAERTVAETTGIYRAALDDAGWAHETQQGDEEATGVIQLHGPLCGAVIILPTDGGTSVLASVLDCDRVRDRPPVPAAPEG